MIPISIHKIITVCKGKMILEGTKDQVNEISTDTRKMKEESLFVPLIGAFFDGHQFILQAMERGAIGALVQKGQEFPLGKLNDFYVIEVEDTLQALKEIGRHYRQNSNIPFIGVTGSTGKTTTKDMIAGILETNFNVLKNEGNLNNQIGLPLTLFNLEPCHEIGVLEMGMNSLGEILSLAKTVQPHIAVITNVGFSHIEHLGSQENILTAKMEITTRLREKDYLLINGDDPFLKTVKEESKTYRIITFGIDPSNDIYAENLVCLGEVGYRFDVMIQKKKHTFQVRQPGIHNVYNGLVALWVGLHYQMTPLAIQKGFDRLELSKMRLEIVTYGDVKVINDAYNASPDSMKAAITVLNQSTGIRKIAILGDILEMGSFAEEGHRRIGSFIATSPVDYLITVGKSAQWIAREAVEQGFSQAHIYQTPSNDLAIKVLKTLLSPRDVVLVKGSRGMKMEEIVNFIQERS
ncbi:UDP-N-acetylmuramoylalanyl-D-glutamyl-2,6-diaminopimelate--D-alanyl-D-alanyl ligase [Alkaliphilus metalliredigens QYMF]|uniref:UDP-N-acetylmuramoyl-tripeptide--D-alanyl-D-alanine ligase n=1 Tax=Alkaliphilus metalliredigens (strain QYMF) TaxID=293826 RepID=A6TS65_ALKMQ|nr:UDP-N-acetylmuramoyl-tripeptide--D-alanyl-D-alanine ligase [Alkaliphilus metalliredigens]ABR49033.1 UDP-N-acetylmuramoylalanyl-D-glutamyl-2,6-diaminopimelate--D-alanyl-D-alanyl ligase [Alkaliphilus metalliredigens QYMF]